MTKYLLIGTACAFALAGRVAGADKKDAVREIELKEFKPSKIPEGRADQPTIITDEAGVKEAFEDARVRAEVMKKVDFTNEKLLFFRWAGSGGDKLQFEAKGGDVTFRIRPGLTDDIKAHFHLFAMPRDGKWKMAGK